MVTPDAGCIEAEQALLGCLLSMPLPDALDVAGPLGPDDWIDPRHRLVFGAVMACLRAGVRADPVTVLGELRRSGAESSTTADRSAGPLLHDLMAAAPVVASVGHYARIVVEHRARRRVTEAAERLAQVAAGGSLEAVREVVAEEWDGMTKALFRIDGDPVPALRTAVA